MTAYKTNAIRPEVVMIGLLASCAMLLPSSQASTETQLLKRDIVAVETGTVFSYTTAQQKYINDTFTMVVEVTRPVLNGAGQLDGVYLTWAAKNARRNRRFQMTGELIATDLKAGRRINCTWPRQKTYSSSTETFAWVSRDVCEEVSVLGATELSLDASVATGRPLHFKRVGAQVPHTIVHHGRETSLMGMELRSARGDRLVVLSDCDNPLILEAQIIGLVSWRLDAISQAGR